MERSPSPASRVDWGERELSRSRSPSPMRETLDRRPSPSPVRRSRELSSSPAPQASESMKRKLEDEGAYEPTAADQDTSTVKRRKKWEEKDAISMSELPASQFLSFAGIHGPMVEVYLKSNPSKKYSLSKELLCSRSAFFDACFNGSFIEGTTQVVHLDEEIKVEPFEMLLQWLFTGVAVPFPDYECHSDHRDLTEEEVLEFNENVAVFHSHLSKYLDFLDISRSLLFNPCPSMKIPMSLDDWLYWYDRLYGSNVGVRGIFLKPLLPEHIHQIWQLPPGNPHKVLFARVVSRLVQAHLRRPLGKKEYPYSAELESVEGFAKDVFAETMDSIKEGACINCEGGTGCTHVVSQRGYVPSYGYRGGRRCSTCGPSESEERYGYDRRNDDRY